jgi:hypothetical protein
MPGTAGIEVDPWRPMEWHKMQVTKWGPICREVFCAPQAHLEMRLSTIFTVSFSAAVACVAGAAPSLAPRDDSPTVKVFNGSYVGATQPGLGSEVFLGIPYAQPPVGSLVSLQNEEFAATTDSPVSTALETASISQRLLDRYS